MSPVLWLLAALTIVLWRLVSVLRSIGKPLAPAKNRSLRTLIVLGSGGHTAEMLNLTTMLDSTRYCPRCYVTGATDKMSRKRAEAAEKAKDVRFFQVYRSREVGQSYLTSIFTTCIASVHALWIVFRFAPDLILTNGPGTCLPICLAGFLLNLIGIKRVVLVYVESIARVQKLSLTGLILYRLRIMDQIYVQWPLLKSQFPRTVYIGQLM